MLLSGRYQLAEAAKALKPFRQGDLDGLCGLYAVVNAVRLVVHPYRALRRREARQLFECGLATLSHHRSLRWSITNGITHRVSAKLCGDVVAEGARLTGLEIYALPIIGPEVVLERVEAIRLIKRAVRRGSPVLVALMDSYNHASVIAGFSRTRLTLFDSSDHHWVWIRSLSFDGYDVGNPHYVPADSVIAVEAN